MPIVVRSDISDPGIAPYIDGTAAAELEVDGGGDTMPTVIGDILAGIDLVSRGIASRVTLTGFQVPADLARAADEVARVSGCQVLPMIGRGGTVALVVTGSEREGG